MANFGPNPFAATVRAADSPAMTQRTPPWTLLALLLAVAVLLPAALFSLTGMEPDTPAGVVTERSLAAVAETG